ncbi:uncharacterized protein TRIVIDRAFT_215504 [Trichoderma virens Gv29-8]|uniref:Uncharacterized protein n=1 Tax=Hypocrea virens (strain Gv29-8 / FGSC 10586) TaxID=413071 RepID=G9MJP6_HYPVG|nr:uncharacterized protein TRIVIDRAFT_215504 [Trichoderma virens Gv29-8]EHK25709.1 hypothetical protein TRIVIDRAFT_215504 [Trichoderma virens Gv29-8]
MTHSLYGIQDLTLASLIPDYRYPHLDALAPRVVEPGKDFSVSSDYNIHDIFHSTPIYASRPGRRLAKWFRFSSDANSENDITQWRMQAQESRLYMLRQPQAIFKDLCLNSTVRQWLQETFENRADAYFLIGYRSVINATLIRQDKNATEQGSYKTTGERIIAVCYRKVTFRFLKKSDSASLDRDNCWRLFSDDRGDDNEGDVMLEADIMDGDDIDECDVSDLED